MAKAGRVHRVFAIPAARLARQVGFAIAEESLRARWGAKVQDHYTWVIAGDGCLMEGVSQEAIGLAGKQQLSRLIVLWDNNGITIDGKVSISDITDQKQNEERMPTEIISWVILIL